MNIREYKLVNNCDINEFNKEINVLISRGWKLYGNPYCVPLFCGARDYSGDDSTIREDRGEIHCQAMVR